MNRVQLLLLGTAVVVFLEALSVIRSTGHSPRWTFWEHLLATGAHRTMIPEVRIEHPARGINFKGLHWDTPTASVIKLSSGPAVKVSL